MPSTRRVANQEEAALVMAMATAIGNQVFAGRESPIIAAVLAELHATFLLNHQIPDDLQRQVELREDILKQHCETVRHLVAVQEPIEGTLQ